MCSNHKKRTGHNVPCYTFLKGIRYTVYMVKISKKKHYLGKYQSFNKLCLNNSMAKKQNLSKWWCHSGTHNHETHCQVTSGTVKSKTALKKR